MIGRNHRRAIRCNEIAEQPQLGGKVMRLIRMVIHVIAREIGKTAGGDADAVEPELVEPVRGRFEGQMRDAVAAISSSCLCSAIGSGVVNEPYTVRFGETRPMVPMLAEAWPSRSQIWRVNAATDVLPLVPVTAAVVAGWRG